MLADQSGSAILNGQIIDSNQAFGVQNTGSPSGAGNPFEQAQNTFANGNRPFDLDHKFLNISCVERLPIHFLPVSGTQHLCDLVQIGYYASLTSAQNEVSLCDFCAAIWGSCRCDFCQSASPKFLNFRERKSSWVIVRHQPRITEVSSGSPWSYRKIRCTLWISNFNTVHCNCMPNKVMCGYKRYSRKVHRAQVPCTAAEKIRRI